MTPNRRTLIIAGAAAIPSAAMAAPMRGSGYSKGAFTHNVASGDPLSDSVILWTRFLPPGGGTGRIGWEIARDEAFGDVLRRGVARVDPYTDYCVKVEARGLAPDGRYFYRFLGADGPSPTGLTRTAPVRGGERLTVALFSCSNLPFGYFNAYGHAAARDDIDLCVHVGDYIYEYQRGKYPSASQALPDRVIEPAVEIVTWGDYHRRYQSYRSDPDLQDVHRTKPFISVWDDHELANDAWKDGAEEHDPKTEGSWVDRVMSAASAYWDWMPIRGVRRAPWRLYRRFDWGALATILPLDTRLIGRDQQLNFETALGPAMQQGAGPALIQALLKFKTELLDDPRRSILGAAQEAWFAQELGRAKARGARWQIVPQQIVMGQQAAPPEAVRFLAADAPEFVRQRLTAAAMLGQAGLGWNLDSWGGYPKARERFLAACAQKGTNVVVLSGDSHNAWASNLPGGADGAPAAVEIAGTSVSSPGMEANLPNAEPGAREAAMLGANKELFFCDLTNKGYAAVTVTPQEVTSEFVQFANVRTRSLTPSGRAVIRAAASDRGVRAWEKQ